MAVGDGPETGWKMEREKFKAMIVRASKDDLLVILRKVRDKPNADYEDLLLQELDSRYPGWSVSSRRRAGGRKFNRATFEGAVFEFETAKDGYLWLVERFISKIPQLFENPDKKTAQIAMGHGRNYFARSPEKLFKKSPHLRDNAANYHRLSNGWYANTNLDNARKFEVLARLAFSAGLEFEKKWDWVVMDRTDQLLAGQERHRFVLDVWRAFEIEMGAISD